MGEIRNTTGEFRSQQWYLFFL
ncbi:hypothetical protein NC651_032853 [Populus alba x Populus x berolinensis]|nr:hypothetical protein NC651_032853 [Populus alba x Populus x berolinensis]